MNQLKGLLEENEIRTRAKTFMVILTIVMIFEQKIKIIQCLTIKAEEIIL